MNVFETVSAVKADLGAVAKGKTMEQGPARYSYRAIDDVLNALHAPMVTHGLVICPHLIEVGQEARGQTRAGTPIHRTSVLVRYWISGAEGDSIEARTIGEALDSGDKGYNKACTAAFKMLLTQLFAIPFATDDTDDHYVENPASPDKPPQGAQTAVDAADVVPAPGGIPASIRERLKGKVDGLTATQRGRLWALADGAGCPREPTTIADVNKLLALIGQAVKE